MSDSCGYVLKFACAAFSLLQRLHLCTVGGGLGYTKGVMQLEPHHIAAEKSTAMAIAFQKVRQALIMIFLMVSLVSLPVGKNAGLSKRAGQNRQGEAARHAHTLNFNRYLQKQPAVSRTSLLRARSGPQRWRVGLAGTVM